MNLIFKADVKRIGEGFIPIVNEYKNGVFVNYLEFPEAQIYDSAILAYSHAIKEAEALNRRAIYE